MRSGRTDGTLPLTEHELGQLGDVLVRVAQELPILAQLDAARSWRLVRQPRHDVDEHRVVGLAQPGRHQAEAVPAIVLDELWTRHDDSLVLRSSLLF